MIGRCLARQVQRPGQAAVRIQAALDGGLHRLPDFLEIVPDFRTLVHIDIFPETPAGGVAPFSDFRERVHAVHVPGHGHFPTRALGQGAAAHAEHGPFIHDVRFPVDGLEQHAVGVIIEDGFRLPDHPDGRDRLQRIDDGDIGHMSLARRGEGAIEGDFEAMGVRMLFGKHRGGLVRAHGVRRGGSSPDLVEFFERFHPRSFYWGPQRYEIFRPFCSAGTELIFRFRPGGAFHCPGSTSRTDIRHIRPCTSRNGRDRAGSGCSRLP